MAKKKKHKGKAPRPPRDQQEARERREAAGIKVTTTEWTGELIGKIIFAVSGSISLIFIILYIASAFGPTGFDLIMNGNFHFLSAGIVAIAGPYGMYEWYDYRLKLQQEGCYLAAYI